MRGLSLGLSGRTVISHEDKGLKRWNAEVSAQYDPKPASALGLCSRSGTRQAGMAHLSCILG